MATVRVYEIAEVLGMSSAELLQVLKRDYCIELRSASSTIEEVVARPIIERLARRRGVTLSIDSLFLRTTTAARSRVAHPTSRSRPLSGSSSLGTRPAELPTTARVPTISPASRLRAAIQMYVASKQIADLKQIAYLDAYYVLCGLPNLNMNISVEGHRLLSTIDPEKARKQRNELVHQLGCVKDADVEVLLRTLYDSLREMRLIPQDEPFMRDAPQSNLQTTQLAELPLVNLEARGDALYNALRLYRLSLQHPALNRLAWIYGYEALDSLTVDDSVRARFIDFRKNSYDTRSSILWNGYQPSMTEFYEFLNSTIEWFIGAKQLSPGLQPLVDQFRAALSEVMNPSDS